MVQTSGFAHTPTTRLLILCYTTCSILTSLLDIKYLLPIRPTPHLWPYLQFSRILTFQLASTVSTDLLFTVVLLYQFRVLERLWGTRKYTSFLLVCLTLNALITAMVGVGLSAVTFGRWNYIPAGLTGLVFAALAMWREEVPTLYRYKVLTGQRDAKGVVLSDKTTSYVLAAQLGLSQFPYNIIPAGAGWMIGSAWVGDVLPGGLGRWRVARWVVGDGGRGREERERFESLRRRLEEDTGDGMRMGMGASGSVRSVRTDGEGRTGFGGQIAGYFRSFF